MLRSAPIPPPRPAVQSDAKAITETWQVCAESWVDAVTGSLEWQEELGSKLGIRYGLAMVITGPRDIVTRQENPSLIEVEAAIDEVE